MAHVQDTFNNNCSKNNDLKKYEKLIIVTNFPYIAHIIHLHTLVLFVDALQVSITPVRFT
jgi:hypothetical protein